MAARQQVPHLGPDQPIGDGGVPSPQPPVLLNFEEVVRDQRNVARTGEGLARTHLVQEVAAVPDPPIAHGLDTPQDRPRHHQPTPSKPQLHLVKDGHGLRHRVIQVAFLSLGVSLQNLRFLRVDYVPIIVHAREGLQRPRQLAQGLPGHQQLVLAQGPARCRERDRGQQLMSMAEFGLEHSGIVRPTIPSHGKHHLQGVAGYDAQGLVEVPRQLAMGLVNLPRAQTHCKTTPCAICYTVAHAYLLHARPKRRPTVFLLRKVSGAALVRH